MLPKLGKKAEIGKTLTWIIATAAIIIMLAVSFLVVSSFKRVVYTDLSLGDVTDLLATKSLTAYLLTKQDSGENVFQQIKARQDLHDYFNDYIEVMWFGSDPMDPDDPIEGGFQP